MSSEDLLDHFKLEAEVFDKHTVHVSHKLNRHRVRERVEEKWERMEILGEGAFGRVWRELYCRSDRTWDVRAVKVIEKQRMKKYQVDYKKELLALAKFSKDEYRKAEVFVSFLGWYETDDAIFLAMEYFENGDLAQYISTISTEDEVRQITIDLLEGLRIIHAEKFTHRDLKPQNIFVVDMPPQSDGWRVKIGDFGISKRVNNENTALRTEAGTLYFQAPEIRGFINSDEETSEYSNAVDIWSLGCVVYNLSAQRVPFLHSSEVNSFCRDLSRFPKKPLYPRMSEDGVEFIQRLLVPQPAQRITVERALEDPWIVNALAPGLYTPKPNTSRGFSGAVSNQRAPAILGQDQYLYHTESNDTIEEPSQTSQTPGTEPMATIVPQSTANTSGRGSLVSVPDTQSGTSRSYSLSRRPSARSLNTTHQDNASASKSFSSLDKLAKREIPEPQGAMTISAVLQGVNQFHWKAITLKGHSGGVGAVAFSPDGKLIASGSRDETIRLWDAATGEAQGTLKGHSDWVRAVAFSPDGKLIASGSRDKTIRLWDAAIGEAGEATLKDRNILRFVKKLFK